MVYLRYAEAVNRAGKPGLAFAILKYGLREVNLKPTKADAITIPLSELADKKPYVEIFKSGGLYSEMGIHNRGSGYSEVNANYNIPVNITKQDSINFVENAICDELALETAFEGNRFHDLMRISNHKKDRAFLARKVAGKHPGNPGLLELLKEEKNWYMPIKK